MAKPKPAAKTGSAGLPPLPAETAARLKDLTAQVDAGLMAGREPGELAEMLAATTGETAWDLHLAAALAGLAHPAIPGLLAALFGTAADKARRKALKRAFHLLKTRRVPVPEDLLPREEAGVHRLQGPVLVHLSPVMGNGDRYLILEGPREALGGNFLVSLINDREGLRECHLLTLNSRDRRELWEHFRERGLAEWAAPPPAYAVRLLEEAHTRKPDAEGASRYRALKPKIMQNWGSPEKAPDLETLLPPLLPGEQSRLADQSRSLALSPLFISWMPGLEEITPWLQKIKEARESRLVLTDQQRQTRVEEVEEEAVRTLFPLEDRDLWRARLLDMAYFLDLKGQETEARWAQAAAQDLAAGPRGPLAGDNPFLKALVWGALKMAWEYLEKPGQEEAGSPLLAPPTDSLLIKR